MKTTIKVGDVCKVVANTLGEGNQTHDVKIKSTVLVFKITDEDYPIHCHIVSGGFRKMRTHPVTEFEAFTEDELEICDPKKPEIIAKIVAYQLKQS